MGDRCTLYLNFSEKDSEKFKEILGSSGGGDFGEFEGGSATFYDINWGGISLLEELEVLSLEGKCPPFDYEHTAGDSYGACVGICIKGERVEADCNSNGKVVCECGKDGPIQHSLEIVNAYFEKLDEYNLYREMRDQ